ncbi:hypothetical protein EYC80_005124 [Monilinia laxa]|uniref:Uncharacterized protein n=1 Tax=Monilinia laxa TaxID=61186 RepID=A0A5N6KJI4_MONLA|nr:hypothetical protein EYC80_005124 [Monilinia laxa]
MGANKPDVKICGTCLNSREDGLWVKIDAAEQATPIATSQEASLHWRLRDPARGQWRCRLRDSTRSQYICDTVNKASDEYCKLSPEGCGRKKTEGLFHDPPGFGGSAAGDIIGEISLYFAITKADPGFDKII